MKTIQRRTPFFGTPEDAAILGEPTPTPEPVQLVDVTEKEKGELLEQLERAIQRFTPYDGENRTQRLAGVANFVPPTKDDPSRRELLKQRQKQRRGKLDPELRRLQRERLKQR